MIEIDLVTATVLGGLTAGTCADPAALAFLLRRYLATGRGDLSDALGPALAVALAAHGGDRSVPRRAAWLALFADVAASSEDERPRGAATALAAGLAAEWPQASSTSDTATSIDACLRAAGRLALDDLVPAAVDELERLVAGVYRPGAGVARARLEPVRTRGGLGDETAAASALLSAFEITGRLPYAMLAEELMQGALQRGTGGAEPFGAEGDEPACAAARVLCRLAALHADESYRAAAVVAPSAAYRSTAERILEARPGAAGGAAAAHYGLALADWIALPPA